VRDVATAGEAATAMRRLGAARVIVTLGAAGALADGPDGRVIAPALAVQAVDTTGAGDAFNGALAVALAERRALPAALRFACAAAGLACTKRGAQPSMPTRADVERMIER
jgi:ribokinase